MQFVKPYYWEIILTLIIGVIKFAIPLFIPFLTKIVIDDIILNMRINECRAY